MPKEGRPTEQELEEYKFLMGEIQNHKDAISPCQKKIRDHQKAICILEGFLERVDICSGCSGAGVVEDFFGTSLHPQAFVPMVECSSCSGTGRKSAKGLTDMIQDTLSGFPPVTGQ